MEAVQRRNLLAVVLLMCLAISEETIGSPEETNKMKFVVECETPTNYGGKGSRLVSVKVEPTSVSRAARPPPGGRLSERLRSDIERLRGSPLPGVSRTLAGDSTPGATSTSGTSTLPNRSPGTGLSDRLRSDIERLRGIAIPQSPNVDSAPGASSTSLLSNLPNTPGLRSPSSFFDSLRSGEAGGILNNLRLPSPARTNPLSGDLFNSPSRSIPLLENVRPLLQRTVLDPEPAAPPPPLFGVRVNADPGSVLSNVNRLLTNIRAARPPPTAVLQQRPAPEGLAALLARSSLRNGPGSGDSSSAGSSRSAVFERPPQVALPTLNGTLTSLARNADALSRGLSSSISDALSIVRTSVEGMRRIAPQEAPARSGQRALPTDPEAAFIGEPTNRVQDSIVSATNVLEEPCDVCDCLMKRLPEATARSDGPRERSALDRILDLPRLSDRYDDMMRRRTRRDGPVGSASAAVPVIVPPPTGAAPLQNRINFTDRVSEFVDIVNEIDEYVSDRTRTLISNISDAYKVSNG